MWDKIEDVLAVLEISLSEINKFPERRETKKNIEAETINRLKQMYEDLGEDIDRLPAVKVYYNNSDSKRD